MLMVACLPYNVQQRDEGLGRGRVYVMRDGGGKRREGGREGGREEGGWID